jgi:hypothetical protein
MARPSPTPFISIFDAGALAFTEQLGASDGCSRAPAPGCSLRSAQRSHSLIPRLKHSLSNVTPSRFVFRSRAHFLAHFDSRLAKLLSHCGIVVRRYSQLGLEELFQGFTRRPRLSAAYRQSRFSIRKTWIGLRSYKVVYRRVPNVAPIAIQQCDVLRVTIRVAHHVIA